MYVVYACTGSVKILNLSHEFDNDNDIVLKGHSCSCPLKRKNKTCEVDFYIYILYIEGISLN